MNALSLFSPSSILETAISIRSPIQLEIQEIAHVVDLQGADKRWRDFRAVFRTRGDRYRFGLTAICSSWSQLSGNGLITCKVVKLCDS